MSNIFSQLKWESKYWIIILFAVISVFTGSFFLIVFNYDGIEFNGDSFVYFSYANHFKDSLSNLRFPKPMNWPYGYPAALSLAISLGDSSFESARWVNVILGGLLSIVFSLTMLFVSRLNHLENKITLILISFIGAFHIGHGMFLTYQLTIMSDLMAGLLGTSMMLFCWKWKKSNEYLWLALAGIAFGMALCTRYVYFLMVFPILSVILSNLDIKRKNFIKEIIIPLIIFGLSAIAIFLPQFYITLQNTNSTFDNELFNGWNFKNFYSLTHDSVDGHQTAKFPSIIYYSTLPFRMQCFTPLGLILSFLGLKYAIRNLPKWFWLSLVIWYISFDLLLCGIPLQNGRIGFPLCLPILIIMPLGLLECLEKYHLHFKKLLLVTTLACAVSLVISFRQVTNSINEKNRIKATAVNVANYVPKNARVISTSLYAVYNAYPMEVEQSSIYEMKFSTAQHLFNSNKPTFLAIDEDHFLPQWSTYTPGKCYQWIRSHYKCTFLFKTGEYTVYEVQPKQL